MKDDYKPSEYAIGFLNGIKKNYQKMKESSASFEQEHKALIQRIGLDLDAFNIEQHPECLDSGAFQLPQLSERDLQLVGKYLGNREKMYLLEKCVRNINDDSTRRLAEMYYLQRKGQPEIAEEIGHTKSYVSKKLDKAEKGAMVETIDRYFAWKYNVPGGNICSWADPWERKYMIQQDALRGEFRIPKMPWMKALQRLGL